MSRLDDPVNSSFWRVDALPCPCCTQGTQSLRLGPQGCVNTQPLYFGAGSKLTVLGKEGSWSP